MTGLEVQQTWTLDRAQERILRTGHSRAWSSRRVPSACRTTAEQGRANWRCRSIRDIDCPEFIAAKRSRASAGKAGYATTFSITDNFSMAAMIFRSPQQLGQCSTSISGSDLLRPPAMGRVKTRPGSARPHIARRPALDAGDVQAAAGDGLASEGGNGIDRGEDPVFYLGIRPVGMDALE